MVGNNTYSKVIVNMYSLVDILVNRAFTNHKPSRPVFRTFYVVFSSDRTQPQMESSIHCSTSINSEDNSRTRLASPREATSSASVPPFGDRRPKKNPATFQARRGGGGGGTTLKGIVGKKRQPWSPLSSSGRSTIKLRDFSALSGSGVIH